MAKLLEIYKKKESITTEMKNIEQIFSKYKHIHIENNVDRFFFLADLTIDSNKKQNISWEF